MDQSFADKLSLKNLLMINEIVDNAIKKKEPNEIIETMEKLSKQQQNVRSNKEYDQIQRQLDLLDTVAKFNCY